MGIARVGNSPDEYFLAPEVPGRAADANGRFKDRHGRMKRQAARFRIYGYTEAGDIVQELTAADADITWTVHLCNTKAAWFEFHGADTETSGQELPLRNADIENTPEAPNTRDVLAIDPGPRSIAGPSKSGSRFRFDSGTFKNTSVPLGELRTDEAGRLIVLGGYGRSASIAGRPVTDFANNDDWFDDTSDGPVTAQVVLKNGRRIEVTASSWVIVAPPDYAPAVGNLVSLYDIQVGLTRSKEPPTPQEPVSFTNDILPVLSRAVGYRWVSDLARRGHGTGAPGDFLSKQRIARLADNTATARPIRQRIFRRLRDPNLEGPDAIRQANLTYMPQLSGDRGFTTEGEPDTWFSALPHQYAAMRRWADGDFESDWNGNPSVPQSITAIDLQDQPHALDRAAMETCVGGPFFPGIEITYISRDPGLYAEPHRFRADLAPGDLTKRMALPWQADFYECRGRWWPAQRPDEVITEAEYQSVIAALTSGDPDAAPPALRDLRLSTERWDRGLGQDPNTGPDAGDDEMVTAWSELGVVRPKKLPNGQTVQIESERRKYFGMRDRDYFHMMLNIEHYPDFLPTARELAQRFLADAKAVQNSDRCPDDLRPFTYSTSVLRSRLEQIYTQAAQSADSFSVADSRLTRELLIDRLLQMAPFNQLDGAWLRNIAALGPIDEVHALLFHVWMDEVGNGQPKLNHSNIYTDLLRSAGVYLEPVTSRAYAENTDIVDSAFTSPLFQLVVSEFSEDYFPEIVGMTLYLEWAVVSVKPQIALMESLGLDPHFYRLHVGIDNAASGHGAMARRAVEIYMDDVRASNGEQAMQETWSRVWNGYVAFATTGGLGEDFRRRAQQQPNPGQRVYDLIRRKEHFGAQNHGTKQLGHNLINNWFADPPGFMRALVGSGYIIPGNIDDSPFFGLLRSTGPMFRVFTDDEVRIWEDWTRSLADPNTPSEPETDIAQLMSRLVDTLRPRQQGSPGHGAHQLTGASGGSTTTQPVAAWFDQPAPDLLAALADPVNGWITPSEPSTSRFVTELASGNHDMARVMAEVAPGTAHKTWRTIAIEWISAGCPLPAAHQLQPQTTQAAVAEVSTPERSAGTAGHLKVNGQLDTIIPQLSLFQNETWQAEFDAVEILGNGALH